MARDPPGGRGMMAAMPDASGAFHEGELPLQEARGEREAGSGNGGIIADRILPNAVPFIARQELAVVASADRDGRLWCSPLMGPPGSFTAPGLTRVALSRAA